MAVDNSRTPTHRRATLAAAIIRGGLLHLRRDFSGAFDCGADESSPDGVAIRQQGGGSDH